MNLINVFKIETFFLQASDVKNERIRCPSLRGGINIGERCIDIFVESFITYCCLLRIHLPPSPIIHQAFTISIIFPSANKRTQKAQSIPNGPAAITITKIGMYLNLSQRRYNKNILKLQELCQDTPIFTFPLHHFAKNISWWPPSRFCILSVLILKYETLIIKIMQRHHKPPIFLITSIFRSDLGPFKVLLP